MRPPSGAPPIQYKLRQPSEVPPKKRATLKKIPHTISRSALAEKPEVPFMSFNMDDTYVNKNDNYKYKYKYVGKDKIFGLKFQNIESKQIIIFVDEKHAHLSMKQEAWAGGKKRTKKNKTNKK